MDCFPAGSALDRRLSRSAAQIADAGRRWKMERVYVGRRRGIYVMAAQRRRQGRRRPVSRVAAAAARMKMIGRTRLIGECDGWRGSSTGYFTVRLLV